MKQYRHIAYILLTLLLMGSVANEAWAYKVTYHVLTLPFTTKKSDGTNYRTDIRVEAIRIIVDNNGTSPELPALYRSPLAKDFTYYAESAVEKSVNAEQIYQNNGTKAHLYTITGSPLTSEDKINKDCHIYVTYSYNSSNTIADLTGGTTYNIMIRGGFLAYNRGRNNRPAVVPERYITAEHLSSEDFVKVDVSDGKSGITTYWDDKTNNKNKRTEVESQFNFLFTYEGNDPYNIIIRSKYNNATACFVEKNIDDSKFVNKYYKGAALYAHEKDNIFLSSDDHIKYNFLNQDTSVKNVTSESKPGYYHGLSNPIWGSFALLNNTTGDGYVFMASRTVNNQGVINDPSKSSGYYNYYYLTNTNNNNNSYNNNLSIKSMKSEDANNYSTAKKMYKLKTINFKVVTPFGNELSASIKMSEYSIDVKQQLIDAEDIPNELKRKYCNFSKFYKSSTFTEANEIEKYSEATDGNIYVSYEVSPTIPFKSVTASDTTWYELTDAGSTQEYGRKIKFDGTNFKNDGANGEYVKASEFAFIGDPYELRVISRSKTWSTPSGVSYMGVESPFETDKALTTQTSATEGYSWDIPNDAVAGSFLLRKYNSTGHWSWNAVQPTQEVRYGTDTSLSYSAGKDAQTITFNLSGLNGSKYYKITTGGSDASQIISVTPNVGFVVKETGTTATITVKLAENTEAAKTMTITIQEYNDDEGTSASGTASVITITQGTSSSSFTPSTVNYSTANFTYVKVLELPKRKFTYHIVDKAGNIAAKATTSQAIYSLLSVASIPSIIVSPFILDETITFYSAYGGTGRESLSSPIIELSGGNSDPEVSTDIYVKYTTAKLDQKAAKLNETQEFNVKLNGQFIYYDKKDNVIKTDANPSNLTSSEYLWKLRNRDPYAMLIDNMGAREDLSVSGTESVTVYNDNGEEETPTPTRQKGAWVISDIPTSLAAGTTTIVNIEKNASGSISIVVTGLTNGSTLSVDKTSDGNLSSISVSPTSPATVTDGTATITATLAANATESPVRSTITLTESGSGSTTTKIVLIQDKKVLGFTTSRISAKRFIAKSSTASSVYEVMEATNTVDAGTTYYNIGCPEENTVGIYDNLTYAHGNDVLKFVLNQNLDFTYHLIDLAKHDLLVLESKTPDLALPAEYQSPLVEKYTYYAYDQIDIDESKTPYEYKPKDPAKNITNISDLYAKYTITESSESEYTTSGSKLTAEDANDLDSKARVLTGKGDYYYYITDGSNTYKKVSVSEIYRGNQIYVTYEKNDLVTFNDKGSPYMLRFLNPYSSGYYLEDGNDKLTTTKSQAVYPYCNGDGSLNIYSDDTQKEQFNGGASTRPRWIWYFESDNDDPYHVKIHSNSSISFKGVSNPTYLQTYAVHFKQDANEKKQRIITGGVLAGIASVEPTEYMILGTPKAYKLLTTQPVKADLDGDGNSNGDGENARREVKSLEQYWKTYNMIKLHLLGKSKSTDKFSNDESTWVVPEGERETLNTKLAEKGIGSGNWHSYDVIANATRWNGYNDKEDGHEKKVVENQEHWFQTFDMGNGSFDIESASIPPVLVLLDRHGWEIMRKPLPTSTYPYGADELAALRAYDSPMVKEYKFYNNATKASGCHKYTLRMQNGKERDQIKKADGEHYTSKSLAVLPPLTATGVKDANGIFQDQYVTYTVKEEYENSYKYHLELHEEDSTYTESGTASKFLILQSGRYMRDNSDKYSGKSYHSKPIGEHTDPAGGNVYDMILHPVNSATVNIDANEDGIIDDRNFWYVQPNLNIDLEMGIKWAELGGGSNEPFTEYETKKTYKDKTGFDPYNLQFKNADGSNNKYLTTGINTTSLSGGSMVGDYSGGSTDVTLAAAFTDYRPTVNKGSEGYDHTYIQMSNQTFMAVSDGRGNMQLMPRFDHTKRVDTDGSNPWYTTLEDSLMHTQKASVDDNSSMGNQTTFLVRPQVFKYHIIDHEGREALSYKRAGDYEPEITEHFKSPLAYDFKYYFDHAAYSSSASSRTAYNAAATSTAFKQTATSNEDMASQAKLLEVLDDYYFQIGTNPYTYKKVTLTKAHSGSTDATYTITDCTETDWTNAIAYRKEAASEAAMQAAILGLGTKGLYYYQLGSSGHYAYKKVIRADGKNTVTITTESDYSSSGSDLTALDEADFEAKAKALSSDGTYYYKLGPLYNYQKVVVTNVAGNITTEIHDKKDISDKEITGSFANAGLNAAENDVYVRYRYWADADVDQNKILQGKWFTIKLANKDVQADGAIGFFQRTAASEEAYGTAMSDLTVDGDYYFKIGNGEGEPPYTYKKVTVSGETKNDFDSDATAWANALDGTGVSLYTGSKPDLIDGTITAKKVWQWKLLVAPMDPNSIYYEPADPYAIELFNREKNYSATLEEPNPMSVPIKINGANHFVLLSHPNGGYALAAQGSGYTYTFLNGASMTTSIPATTIAESTNESDANHFTIKSNALSPGTELILNDDVTHTYTYNVINNDDSGNVIAITGTQDNATAKSHNYAPYLPDEIQSPLLNATDYSYYGNVSTASAPYKVVEDTKLHTLYGLYKDEVYVRYDAYDVNQTKYKVPNKRNATGTGQVAKDASSKDASLNIAGRLPYNIIWYNDNMMQSTDNTTISDGVSKALSGDANYAWQFEGGDPYALKIKHKASGKYINNSSGTTCTLGSTATPFMLLKKNGNDVLQVTGGTNMLSGYGNTLVGSNPTKFIIFGLSVNDLIYHLVICPTNTFTPIPYRETKPGTEHANTETWEVTDVKQIEGSTQRDLESRKDDSEANPKGSKYQLGSTMYINDGSTATAYTYNYDVGSVSIGDLLEIPTEFYRPNCSFDFYIDGIYDNFDTGTQTLSNPNTTLNNLYKGVKLDEAAPRLMSDENLINKVIRVNIVYSFDKTLKTNSGLDFVRNVSDNFWYTFETYDGATPYLAHYTNAWGLQSMEGRETRYTNDYLWTPLGDPYGFKMYNRYMIKNSGADNKIMTTSNASFSDDKVEGTKLKMEEPAKGSKEERNAIYELLSGDADGYFRIHPVINNTGTQYYVWRKDTSGDIDGDDKDDLDYTILSTEPCDWTFRLDMALLEPYYDRAGYIGGLTTTPKEGQSKSGKQLYEEALKENIMEIQRVVYDDNNIVDFAPGYYRLHSVPGTPDVDPVRYASGYIHDIERDQNKDGNESDAIPMHFYSKEGTSTTFETLKNGFTETNATRGEIPIAPTENDPSTIFYLDGGIDSQDSDDSVNPRVTMSTQGLYVKGIVPKIEVDEKEVDDPDHGSAVMTATPGNATKFSLIGIGGAVFLITNELDPATRNYLHYGLDYTVGGDKKIYDLKYFHNSPTNEARWCIEPANKKGLNVETHNGGDNFYYTTFCAPYDVKLPDNKEDTTYYAYICEEWNTNVLHPKKVSAVGETYAAGKFVPAGTPVIIRTTDESESVKLTLPSTEPSTALSCVFSGKYLEQLLDNGGGNEVYTLGLPFISDVHKDPSYASNGNIEAAVPNQAKSGVGFYINANPNKEHNALQSLWLRNNRYVLHNKIYYRAGSSGSSAPQLKAPEFVPVIFDDLEEPDEELNPDGSREIVGDGCVYDLMGRKVATREQVEDGSWKQRVASGIYIINGKKIRR